jgi:hypothetical protein
MLWIFLCFLEAGNLFSQDTSYVKGYNYWGNVKIISGVLTQYIDLYTTVKSSQGTENIFVPNVKNTLGFSVNLKYVTLAYAFKINNPYFTADKFGTTDYKNFSLGSNYRWFGYELFYRTYDGFFEPDKRYSSAIIRPDISLLHTGLNLTFFGNSRRFSYRAAFGQSRKQQKSAGGFILTTGFSYKSMKGNSSFIASYMDDSLHFGKYTGIHDLSFGLAELRPGYAYNFVTKDKRWYLCPFISGGAGASIYHYVTSYKDGYTIALHLESRFCISTGFDVERFFVNFTFDADRNANYLSSSAVFAHTIFNVYGLVGMRFGQKKQFKQKAGDDNSPG